LPTFTTGKPTQAAAAKALNITSSKSSKPRALPRKEHTEPPPWDCVAKGQSTKIRPSNCAKTNEVSWISLDQSGCGLNMEEFYSPKKMDSNNTRNKQLLGGFTKGHGIEFLLEGWSFHISFWWLKSRGPVNSPGDAEEERDGTSRVGRDLKIRRF